MKTGPVFLTLGSSFMKRLLVCGALGLLATHASIAQQNTFNWFATHTFVMPADPPPDIDAQNVVFNNGSVFGVDLTFTSNFLGSAFNTFPFTTVNTLNFTNRGILIGVPGFDFENFPDPQPPPQPG